MTCFRHRLGAGAAAFALAVAAPRAFAQAEDQAASRSLFDEGRRLAESGHYDLACPKFEAARKLYTSAGVLLNLGDCYEKVGRTASAWTIFGETAAVADRTMRPAYAVEARQRQAVLEPRLVHLIDPRRSRRARPERQARRHRGPVRGLERTHSC
jgi:tetratricopeptide (TPR) repeat protein